MGFYRSQLFVNTESPIGYEYAMNSSDVDGISVRTFGEDGRISQFYPATFNKPIIISSNSQRYIYTKTTSISNLPNFNSEIKVIDNNYNIVGDDWVVNCANFNQPISINFTNSNVRIDNHLVWSCNNFNSDIVLDFMNNNGNHYLTNLVRSCPNYNGNIYIINGNFGTYQRLHNVVTQSYNYNGAFIFEKSSNLMVTYDIYNQAASICDGMKSNGRFIFCNSNNIVFNAYNCSLFIPYTSFSNCNSVNSTYYIFNMQANHDAIKVIADNVNTISPVFLGQSSTNININLLSFNSIGCLNYLTWPTSKVLVDTFILNNCKNINSDSATVNLFNSSVLAVNNLILTNVSVKSSFAIFYGYNSSKMITDHYIGGENIYIDNITGGRVTLYQDVVAENLTNDSIIDCRNIKNVSSFCILNQLAISSTSPKNCNLTFECGNIPSSTTVWSQTRSVPGGFNFFKGIYINADTIYGTLFSGNFTQMNSRVVSLNIFVNANMIGSASSYHSLLSIAGNGQNSMFSQNTNILFSVSNYFNARILNTQYSTQNVTNMNATIKFNTSSEITLGKIMNDASGLSNIRLISDINANPTNINICMPLISSISTSKTHTYLCDSTMYNLMNDIKTLDNVFVESNALTWESTENGVYNSYYNIYILNNA